MPPWATVTILQGILTLAGTGGNATNGAGAFGAAAFFVGDDAGPSGSKRLDFDRRGTRPTAARSL